MKRLAVVLAVAALPAAAGGLASAQTHAQAQHAAARVFRVTLAGENESPAGDPVATGAALFRVRAGQPKICYQLAARDLSGPAAAAHIHRGVTGTSGPVLIPLRTPNTPGGAGGCADD